MMDEYEITGGESGIDRRDFIRKSALVGGMVWAAPMISSIGSPAFAATVPGDGNGTGEPNGTGQAISFVAFLFRECDPETGDPIGPTYRSKADVTWGAGGPTFVWDDGSGGNDPFGCLPDNYATQTPASAFSEAATENLQDSPFNFSFSVETDGTETLEDRLLVEIPVGFACSVESGVKTGAQEGCGCAEVHTPKDLGTDPKTPLTLRIKTYGC